MSTFYKFVPASEAIEIKDFCNRHGLQMTVHERDDRSMQMYMQIHGEAHRYYASIDNAEVDGDGVLIGAIGNGNTPDDAIKYYCERISHKKIIINAFSKDSRNEIWVPGLKHTPEDHP